MSISTSVVYFVNKKHIYLQSLDGSNNLIFSWFF